VSHLNRDRSPSAGETRGAHPQATSNVALGDGRIDVRQSDAESFVVQVSSPPSVQRLRWRGTNPERPVSPESVGIRLRHRSKW
jgi:hypothetical protein